MPGLFESNPGVFVGLVVMIYAVCRLVEIAMTIGIERWEQRKALK